MHKKQPCMGLMSNINEKFGTSECIVKYSNRPLLGTGAIYKVYHARFNHTKFYLWKCISVYSNN